MKIAVSGTHCCGKSTFIEAFLRANPDSLYEPEPYMTLVDDYGEVFAAEPSLDDFYRQLEFNVEGLRCYRSDERVIYERSPVDFLAYMLALGDLRRQGTNTRLIRRSLGVVAETVQLPDLIVFLPLDDGDDGGMAESEDPELRSAVNRRLIGVLSDDDFNLFTSRSPVILEATGSTSQRLSKRPFRSCSR